MNATADTFTQAWNCQQAGAFAYAEQLSRQVVELDPCYADAWWLLGKACQAQQKLDDAESNFRRTLLLLPGHAAASNSLGIVLILQGKPAEAVPFIRQALACEPGNAEFHNNLGLALARLGQSNEAIPCYRQALALTTQWATPWNNLGNALEQQGKLEEAIPCYQQTVRIDPNFAEAYHNIGYIFQQRGKLDHAVGYYQHALRIDPTLAEAHCNLGTALHQQGKLDEALSCYQHAVNLKPHYAEAHHSLAVALVGQGRWEEAKAGFRRALELRSDLAAAHTSFLLGLNYDPEADPDFVFAEHCRWGQQHLAAASCHVSKNQLPVSRCELLIKTTPACELRSATGNSNRPLRVGYVSPDLRRHAMARYLEPVLVHHDPNVVEVVCYAEVAHPDEVTARLQRLVPTWRSTCGLTDSQLGEQIRNDSIDILVDLAGHTGGNRLLVFARRAAPVQATWLGYLNTTGLNTVDYRLTDDILDPPGLPKRDTEELLRLPGGFCCFTPPTDAPEVAPLPALQRGHLTFGSLNSLFKLNGKVFDLWSDVLRAVPTARLLLFRDTLTIMAQQYVRKQFEARGILASRLDLRRGSDGADYLGVYEEIDVCLDTFPWSGGVTTCESLWMGVPVLSLRGPRPASRHSAMLLTRVGLSEWAVDKPDQYVAFAVQLAKDVERLTRLRCQLRERMRATVCDAEQFTRGLENAYRIMWRCYVEDARS